MTTFDVWKEVTFNSRDPVYQQVVRHFKELIVTSRMEAGQVIPSRRELAALLKINPNTAQRAYKEIEEQQLIVTEGNSPSRITTNKDVLQAVRTELLKEAVYDFVASVCRIDAPLEEILALVRERFDAENGGQGGESHD